MAETSSLKPFLLGAGVFLAGVLVEKMANLQTLRDTCSLFVDVRWALQQQGVKPVEPEAVEEGEIPGPRNLPRNVSQIPSWMPPPAAEVVREAPLPPNYAMMDEEELMDALRDGHVIPPLPPLDPMEA